MYRYGRLKLHISPLDGDFERLIVDEPQTLRTREFAASLSFENPSREPLVIGAACASGGVGIVVYDDAHRVVAATTGASLPPQSEEFVVVTLPEGTYHAQFIRGGIGEELSCTVDAVGLADRTLTGPVEQALPFAAKAGFDAFLIESTGGSIAPLATPTLASSSRCGAASTAGVGSRWKAAWPPRSSRARPARSSWSTPTSWPWARPASN